MSQEVCPISTGIKEPGQGFCLPGYHAQCYLKAPEVDVIDGPDFVEDVGRIEPGPHKLPDGRRDPVDKSECG